MLTSRCRRAPARIPLRPGLAVLLALLLAPPPARGGGSVERLDLTAAEWREDLRYFASQLPRRHANAFHFVAREVFDREVARLDSAIVGLNGTAVFTRLMRLAAMVGDGHTGVHIPNTFLQNSYPLGVRNFGNQLRVIRTATGADSALGMRLLSIDDTPVAEILSRLDPLLAQDENPGLREAEIPGFLALGGILRGIGVVRDERHVHFTFEDDRGARLTLTLAPTVSAKEAVWHFTSPELPLYRMKRTEPLAFTWLPESRTVYCNFRGYEGLGQRARELFDFVDRHPVDRLVIDLRQNGGGDFNHGRRHLVEPIVKRPAIDREGHLFVIVGPITFSAALANAVDFRNRTRAMLVGEPIGEKPNSYSENDEFVLPHSHLTVSYSTRYYQFAPGKDVVAPDQVIVPTWEEFRAGRDPVLEWILTCCR